MLETSASKRYSPLKLTKSISERNDMIKKTKLQSQKHFCHFSNAVYMGGMDSFKLNGDGIFLLDNGACAITRHSFSNMIDFNVVFRSNSLTAIVVKPNKNKYICQRSGPYLLSAQLNSRGKAYGIGYFVDFVLSKLYKVTFYQSKVQKKQELMDQKLNNAIFNKNDLRDILGDNRLADAINYNFEFGNGIKCIKKDGEVHFGFAEQHKPLSGLVFKLKINEDAKNFSLSLKQRGYFEKQKMAVYGQKHFKNGNYYVGGFKNTLFDGNAMLVNPTEQKWTYGYYKKGELVSIYESSATSQLKMHNIFKKIHQNYDSYIENSWKFSPSETQMSKIVDTVVDFKSELFIEDPLEKEKKRILNLRSIKDDYISGHFQSNTHRALQDQTNKILSYRKMNKYTDEALSCLTRDKDDFEQKQQQTYDINVLKVQNPNGHSKNENKFRLNISPLKGKPNPSKNFKKTFELTKIKANKNERQEMKQISSNIDNMNKYFKESPNTAANSHRTKNNMNDSYLQHSSQSEGNSANFSLRAREFQKVEESGVKCPYSDLKESQIYTPHIKTEVTLNYTQNKLSLNRDLCISRNYKQTEQTNIDECNKSWEVPASNHKQTWPHFC